MLFSSVLLSLVSKIPTSFLPDVRPTPRRPTNTAMLNQTGRYSSLFLVSNIPTFFPPDTRPSPRRPWNITLGEDDRCQHPSPPRHHTVAASAASAVAVAATLRSASAAPPCRLGASPRSFILASGKLVQSVQNLKKGKKWSLREAEQVWLSGAARYGREREGGRQAGGRQREITRGASRKRRPTPLVSVGPLTEVGGTKRTTDDPPPPLPPPPPVSPPVPRETAVYLGYF
ncbi:hypothetical protein E2C01_017704 [Portunus trituberculatus]|uniref:Uncharacterized protein n=1 Tax=Portunus trituberculatus TaxID=210409 RepID=A0A5B7DUK0_PORTR|nr:hypothetical protein [Portunus trituberculatus]